jgi:hypothetical protein
VAVLPTATGLLLADASIVTVEVQAWLEDGFGWGEQLPSATTFPF